MGDKGDRCVLCLDSKRSPVLVTCGHSFCNECLDVYKSYQVYAWATRCPICREVLKDKLRPERNPLSLTQAPPSPATPDSPVSGAPTEEVYLLEEFMAVATDSETNDDEMSEDDEHDMYYLPDEDVIGEDFDEDEFTTYYEDGDEGGDEDWDEGGDEDWDEVWDEVWDEDWDNEDDDVDVVTVNLEDDVEQHDHGNLQTDHEIQISDEIIIIDE